MATSSFAETTASLDAENATPPKMSPKPDFAAYTNIAKRKSAFADFVKPGIDFMNAQIKTSRDRLNLLKSKTQFSQNEYAFMNWIATEYKLSAPTQEPSMTWFNEALKRVDIIPADLVLSQAAIESSWGTSRFAVEGNNYFGQWCYEAGCGMVPLARPSGRTYEVKVFSDTYDSIQGYFSNVNTNDAYLQLRNLREIFRRSGQPILGYQLAEGLKSYSQRGEAYVREVQEIMEYNKKLWD